MKFLYNLKHFRGLVLALALVHPVMVPTRVFAMSAASEAQELEENEKKAIAIFLAFMCITENTKDHSLKWARAVERIIELLKTNPKYAKLCATLRQLQNEKNALTIGMALKKHLAELPQEVQVEVTKKGVNGLRLVFNTRI
ncbi:MAG: hypothetical protein WC707_03580 [Candidatus Babeliaceae bacterium]|jgi:hypothetical protein